ncbi:MAG: Crp/Fnr family transcriptional regulator [Aquabacterium sp.]|jgi:CRP/FNR family cyclic AMP-dependent transcriptional regulator|nr:MAG: Crp/Fnr family transcriptional regulator [Aquabacterium sp.]
MPKPAFSADLSALPPSVRALAERGVSRLYRKGTLIINEGESGDTLFVIVSGRVKAFSVDARGREVTFGSYGAGEYLGEMSLDGGPRSASVITLEPTVCAVVHRPALQAHIAEHPDFAFELLTKVIARARVATQTARNMALLDVYGRVVQLLESMAVLQPDGSREIHERLTHAEIASRAGCSREMVSRLLKDLARGNYLTARGNMIRLEKSLPARW